MSNKIIHYRMVITVKKKASFIAGAIAVFVFCSVGFAQTDPFIDGSDIRPFTASGSIGLSASAYTASGIQNRRAPASLQTNANLNFSVFGFSSGLNLLYSTDQSRLRQNMNNLSFDASWKWLTVQAGDVSPAFSEYGLNGTTIRGGYLQVSPGNWLVELSGGRSRRKVDFQPRAELREPAYERWAVAGKIGYGSDDDSHFFLSSHYSIDKKHSVDNPGTITPQENLTITPDAQLLIFDGAISLASQVTFSAYTRDLNSPLIPLGGIGVPAFLTNIMSAHTSSRINYAGQASADLDLDQFGLQLGYERVQPGFISLGVGRTRDDQQKVRISPSVQLFDNKLSLQGNIVLGRDNLLNTRLHTQQNTTIGTTAQLQLTDRISINGNYNLMVNDISSNTKSGTPQQGGGIDQVQVSNTFMLQPAATFQRDEHTHNVSISGSYFTLTNEFEGPGSSTSGNFASDTYSSSVTYSLTFPSGFSVNTMSNFLINRSNRSENISTGANFGAVYSLFERKMTLSLNAGINQNRNEINRAGPNQDDLTVKARQLMLNMTANYRLTSKDTFSLSVRNRSNNVLQGGSSRYAELEGNFKYQHRF
ncbi:hypothetical protein ACG2F4_10710 [Halalkalibaculum sp. DA3122]|uniref:hypothetical protein n=1 Tax=unclassified Halalkalibaculum TaxID=2964617 RepID=UPI003754BAAF